MNERRYADLQIHFFLGGVDHSVRTIISLVGAIKIFDYDRASAAFGNLLGKVVKVRIEDHHFAMYFTREFNQEGRFYNLKFVELRTNDAVILNALIEAHAIVPPWKRTHPRLDSITSMDEVPVPTIAVARFDGQFEVFRVLNFTLGGCLFEGSNPSYLPTEINQPINFDLRISNGEELTGISGRVVRVSYERLPDHDHHLIALGVRIVHMRDQDLQKYRYLIRTYCQLLKS